MAQARSRGRRIGTAEAPLQLDSNPPKGAVAEFMENETRFRMVKQADGDRYAELLKRAQKNIGDRFAFYQAIAGKK